MVAKVLWTLGVWAFCAVACLVFLAETRLGPTLWNFNERHGVHLGDVAAAVAFPAYAAWFTWSVWRRRPGR